MSSNVCTDQQSFNTAFSKALKNYNSTELKKDRKGLTIFAIIYLALFIWAVVLALSIKTTSQSEKIIHIVLACIAPPIYIVGYYISV